MIDRRDFLKMSALAAAPMLPGLASVPKKSIPDDCGIVLMDGRSLAVTVHTVLSSIPLRQEMWEVCTSVNANRVAGCAERSLLVHDARWLISEEKKIEAWFTFHYRPSGYDLEFRGVGRGYEFTKMVSLYRDFDILPFLSLFENPSEDIPIAEGCVATLGRYSVVYKSGEWVRHT